MIPQGNISEILARKGPAVWTISPEATVFEAIQLMSDKNVGALLVTEGARLIGVISERDYTRKVALKGKSSKELKVREIVSQNVISVTPSHAIEECMRLMTENRVRHLAVIDGPSILGVVSMGDLVNHTIRAQESTIQQLQAYVGGSYPV